MCMTIKAARERGHCCGGALLLVLPFILIASFAPQGAAGETSRSALPPSVAFPVLPLPVPAALLLRQPFLSELLPESSAIVPNVQAVVNLHVEPLLLRASKIDIPVVAEGCSAEVHLRAAVYYFRACIKNALVPQHNECLADAILTSYRDCLLNLQVRDDAAEILCDGVGSALVASASPDVSATLTRLSWPRECVYTSSGDPVSVNNIYRVAVNDSAKVRFIGPGAIAAAEGVQLEILRGEAPSIARVGAIAHLRFFIVVPREKVSAWSTSVLLLIPEFGNATATRNTDDVLTQGALAGAVRAAFGKLSGTVRVAVMTAPAAGGGLWGSRAPQAEIETFFFTERFDTTWAPSRRRSHRALDDREGENATSAPPRERMNASLTSTVSVSDPDGESDDDDDDESLMNRIRLLRHSVIDRIALLSVSSISAVITLLSAVVNPALTGQTARIYLIIELSTCNYEDVSNVEVIFYPLQFGIGDDQTRRYFASVVFTWIFILLLFAIHMAVVHIAGRAGPISLAVTKRLLHFPSLSITALALFFWQPLIMASVTVLSRGEAEYARVLSLCLLIAALAISSMGVRWYHQRIVRVEFIDAEEYDQRVEEDFFDIQRQLDQECKAAAAEAKRQKQEEESKRSRAKQRQLARREGSKGRRGRESKGTSRHGEADDGSNSDDQEESRPKHVVVQVPMSPATPSDQLTLIERLCTADGTWYDKIIEERIAHLYPFEKRGFTDRYGYMFLKYRKGRHWFFLVEIIVSSLLGVAQGIKPLSLVQCWGLSIFHFVVLLGYFLLLAGLRPYLTRFDNGSFAFLALAQAVSVLFLVVDARKDHSVQELLDRIRGGAEEEVSPNTTSPMSANSTLPPVIAVDEAGGEGIRISAEFLAFSCFSLCIVKGALDLALMYYFWRQRQRQFEEKADEEEEEEEESSQASRSDSDSESSAVVRDRKGGGKKSKQHRAVVGSDDDDNDDDDLALFEMLPKSRAASAVGKSGGRSSKRATTKGSARKGKASNTSDDELEEMVQPLLRLPGRDAGTQRQRHGSGKPESPTPRGRRSSLRNAMNSDGGEELFQSARRGCGLDRASSGLFKNALEAAMETPHQKAEVSGKRKKGKKH